MRRCIPIHWRRNADVQYIKLPPHTETIIEITTSRDANILRVITKEELMPEFMMEELTKSVNGQCVVSIPNTFYTEINTQTSEVHLEPYEADLDENIRRATKSNDESKRIKGEHNMWSNVPVFRRKYFLLLHLTLKVKAA
jgi:hypothetical protein